MSTSRRTVLSSALATAFAATLAPAARAQGQGRYPERNITIVDCFAAGGSSHIFARVLAEQLGQLLGGSVVVENRLGAGGAVGADYVAKAKPDGYTLGMATVSTLVSNPAVNTRLGYDPQKDFAYISKLLVVPSVLVVHPSLPAKTLPELIALAKTQPDTIPFGSPGTGSAGHVLLVPTYTEVGYPQVSQPLWFGLVAPKGTPPEIVAQLNAAVHKAVASIPFQDKLKSVSATAAVGTPEAFRKDAAELLVRYRQVAKTANIQVG